MVLNFEEIKNMSDEDLKEYCDNINFKIETMEKTIKMLDDDAKDNDDAIKNMMKSKMMDLAKSQSPEQKDTEAWIEFRNSGFLWMINSILHMFGYAIVYNFDNNGKLTHVVPKRVKFRGFSEERNTTGYKQISQYMVDNAEQLLKEASDDPEDVNAEAEIMSEMNSKNGRLYTKEVYQQAIEKSTVDLDEVAKDLKY